MRFCLILAGLFASSLQAAELPNIVLILADDLGSGDLGCYNPKSKIATPNLDRLAAEGLRCTDAHSPSGVCTPTRYGILTGRYAWRTRLKQGVFNGYDPVLIEKDRMTLASLLKKHRYATHCVGKWHLGLGAEKPTDYDKPLPAGPLTVGFDTFFGIPASLDMPPYLYVRNDAPVEKATEKIGESKMRRHGGGGFWRGGPIAPGFKHEDVLPKLTEEAERIIARHIERSDVQRFFLYLPLTSPHTPWMPTKEFQGKSKAGWYGDFVEQTDAAVGRVLAKLKEYKLDENTLVIFTSDNGAHWLPEDIKQFDHQANNGRRGQKADIWEGGHRIPLLCRWPGKVKPGTVSDDLICLTDFLATFAEMTETPLPANAGEDSASLMPILQGKKRERPAVVHHSATGMFAVRHGDWKLIEGLGSGGFTAPQTQKPTPDGPQGQLYNLAKDPREEDNRYLNEPETVKRLTELLAKLRKEGRSVEVLKRN